MWKEEEGRASQRLKTQSITARKLKHLCHFVSPLHRESSSLDLNLQPLKAKLKRKNVNLSLTVRTF